MELDTARTEHVKAATALLHGILTEPGGFTRADSDDFQAAGYLSRFRDAELLQQVMNQARSKQAMEIIRRALGDRVTVESFSIAGIGYLRADDRDAIAEASDFLKVSQLGGKRDTGENELAAPAINTGTALLASASFP